MTCTNDNFCGMQKFTPSGIICVNSDWPSPGYHAELTLMHQWQKLCAKCVHRGNLALLLLVWSARFNAAHWFVMLAFNVVFQLHYQFEYECVGELTLGWEGIELLLLVSFYQ